MDNLERFDKFANILKNKYCNKLNIKYKNESWFMKFLSKILFFAPEFTSKYTTTIGNSVYFPSRLFVESNSLKQIETLAHEFRHIFDSNKYSNIIFSLSYLFPQILFILIIPLIFLIGWYSLFCLIFLLPLPAYFRMRWELNGYIMSIFVGYYLMREKGIADAEILKLLNKFAKRIDKNAFRGPVYYFMWPFGVIKQLEDAVEKIHSGAIYRISEIYVDIEQALEQSKAI